MKRKIKEQGIKLSPLSTTLTIAITYLSYSSSTIDS